MIGSLPCIRAWLLSQPIHEQGGGNARLTVSSWSLHSHFVWYIITFEIYVAMPLTHFLNIFCSSWINLPYIEGAAGLFCSWCSAFHYVPLAMFLHSHDFLSTIRLSTWTIVIFSWGVGGGWKLWLRNSMTCWDMIQVFRAAIAFLHCERDCHHKNQITPSTQTP